MDIPSPQHAGAVARRLARGAFTATPLGYLVWYRRANARAEGGPPVVRAFVPYLGSGVAFGRDAAGFLEAQRRKHGDVFRVLLGGRATTFLCDPFDWPTVFKHRRELEFEDLSEEIARPAFGWSEEGFRAVDGELVRDQLRDHLRGGDLSDLSARFARFLDRALDERIGFGSRHELYTLVGQLAFFAGADALFGDGFADESIYAAHQELDRRFPLLVGGAPIGLLGGAREAQRALALAMRAPRLDAGALMKARQAHFEERAPEEDVSRMQAAMIWAAEANTIPAAFWALYLLLTHREALAAIRAELDALRVAQPEGPLATEAVLGLPGLGSAIDESLRLRTASLTLRRVREPIELPLRRGDTVRLGPGDHVAIFPWLTHHDPEIYEAPEEYRWDRFDTGGHGQRRFEKRGERVPFPLLPFGGGRSICPGRHLAKNEIALLVAHLLDRYEVTVEEHEPPGLDHSRAGIGAIPPVGKVPVTLRRRAAAGAGAGR